MMLIPVEATGPTLRKSCLLLTFCVVFPALVTISCGGGTRQGKATAPPDSARVWFVDIADSAGVNWRCCYGTDETDFILETTGPGPAWLDFDNDGWMDLFLPNGSHFDPDTVSKYQPRAALFRNNRDGTFTDVTEKAGVGFAGWAGGALCADFDNDGWTDIFVTNSFGCDVLYRNNGNGTFTDVTRRAGIEDRYYGTSACALDYDRDGNLDIFVVNYVPYDTSAAVAQRPGTTRYTIVRGVPMSMAPEGYPGEPDLLYRNNGDGTFTEVSSKAGLNRMLGRGLGCVTVDFNGDGWVDIYVTNDAMQNFLYRNNGDGTFTDVAGETGAAFGEGGIPAGSMGVNSADLNGDGWMEILVANYEDQTPSVYFNMAGRFFVDRSVPCGIGGPSLIPLQWGLVTSDFNNDGHVDAYFAGGHVSSRLESRYPNSRFAQRNRVFLNRGDGTFDDVTEWAGPGLELVRGSRGASGADYDNDGDIDIAVVEKSAGLSLLRNDTPRAGNWLRVILSGDQSPRDGTGARVKVLSGGRWRVAERHSGSSYAGTEDPRLLFGLGGATGVDSIEVEWSSGERSVASRIPANSTVTFREGRGYEVGTTR